MMRFAHPWVLLALLLLVPLAFLVYRNTTPRMRYSSVTLFPTGGRTWRTLIYRHIGLLRVLAIALGIIAIARPQIGHSTEEVTSEGVDIMLIVDTSGSMRALDFVRDDERVNRLEVVKEALNNFVAKRKSDRIGLVVFGRDAFTQAPLTLDHGMLLGLIDNAEIGMAGETHTAIGSALITAVRRLRDLPAKEKVAILLTDGRNNVHTVEPDTAAEIAQSYGIRVYTIGAGTTGRVPMPVKDPFGRYQIQYQRADLDEPTLRRVAAITGGRYFHAEDTEGLREVYDQIDALETTEAQIERYTTWTERFSWFAIPALALLCVEVLLRQTVALVVP